MTVPPCNLIAVDGGTTNTRIYLLAGSRITDSIRYPVGAGMRQNNSTLRACVREGIARLLTRRHMRESQIRCVVMSGMICSELGIMHVPHIPAPVSLHDLAQCAVKSYLPDICGVPFIGIPGVKNGEAHADGPDFMRGEETEFFGMDESYMQGASLTVLPGSHTKLVFSENGTIVRCMSTLCGEMLAALSENTILKKTFPNGLAKTADPRCIKRGYDLCASHGLNNALFRVRILDRSLHVPQEELTGIFVGAILHDDVALIARYAKTHRVLLGGAAPLRDMFRIALRHAADDMDVTVLEDSATLQPRGAYKIYERIVQLQS